MKADHTDNGQLITKIERIKEDRTKQNRGQQKWMNTDKGN